MSNNWIKADNLNTEGMKYLNLVNLASLDYDMALRTKSDIYTEMCLAVESIFDMDTFQCKELKRTLFDKIPRKLYWTELGIERKL